MRVYKVTGKRGTRWSVDYTDTRGRRIRKVVADTKKAAERYLARVRLDLDRGTYAEDFDAGMTLAGLIPVCEHKPLRNLEVELAMLRRVVELIGPDLQIRKLRIEHWEAARDQLEAEGCVAPASRNRYLSALRSTIKLAIRRGVLGTNPLRYARPERENNVRRRIASDEEEARLWEACHDARDRVLIALSLYAGARRGEIHKAKFKDFEIASRTWWLPDTKSGQPRTLPLHPVVIREVEALREDLGAGEDDRLYDLANSNVLSTRFSRIRDRAGLPDLRLHDLRRTAATRAIVGGVPIPTVMNRPRALDVGLDLALRRDHRRALARVR